MPPSLVIYYATETGNAQGLAEQACARALNEGWHAVTENLSGVRPEDLTAVPLALFIVSTWGDGDPPSDAIDFWNDLECARLDLGRLRFAVLGLGDRAYTEFNGFARKLDERLAALGAQRLHERIEADVDFDDTYAEWAARLFPLLAEARERAAFFA